ncbi:hypothetical protein MNBD_GAMMA08-1908 [hydrothermal vent metagenome]|uniref:Uncharacterized protein n=1 Tax=hydrothermal vent metagenome TaxID=652676 RepID=A0A3B0XXK4_9ZZZZ
MDIQEIKAQLERYHGFLSQDPDNSRLICQIAQLQLQVGDFENAGMTLNTALEKQPDDTSLQFNLSHVYLAEGEFQKALDILSPLDQKINNSAIKYNLAYALLHMKKYEDALYQFELIIDTENLPADTHYWLGRCYYYTGDILNAEKYLQQHISDNSENSRTLGTLALLNIDNGNPEQARQFAELALALNDENPEALISMGNIYLEQQDEERAYDYFYKVSTAHPSNGRAWSGLGLTRMMKLDSGNAIEDLKKATHFMPSHLGTWHALAWAQLVSDDVAGARESLENCLDIDRTFAETYGGLAIIDIIQGYSEAAKEKIKLALRLDRHCFSANFAQSLILENSAPDQSRKIIENMLQTQFSNGNSLKGLLGKQLRKYKKH